MALEEIVVTSEHLLKHKASQIKFNPIGTSMSATNVDAALKELDGAYQYTSFTDPAVNAIGTTAIVDAFYGCLVTLTAAGNAQTLANPTNITPGKREYTVLNNDASTADLVVNGNTIQPGEAISFVREGTTWAGTELSENLWERVLNDIRPIIPGNNLDMRTGNIKNVSEQTFNLTPTLSAHTPGKVYRDTTEETLSFDLPDGGNISIGKETFDYYTNLNGSPIVNGDVCSVIGVSGGRQAVALTDALNDTKANATIGMVTVPTIGNNNAGRLTTHGRVHDLNTLGLTEGMPVYVNPANSGKRTQTIPSYPAKIIHIGIVEVAHAVNGIISVDIKLINRTPSVATFADLVAGAYVGEIAIVRDQAGAIYRWNGSIRAKSGQDLGALTNNKGNWNASTNTPTITSGVGTLGDWYKVSVAGTTTIDGINSRGIGDYIWYDGTTRQKINNQSTTITTRSCTIGVTGADYPTITAALTAGFSELIQVSNVSDSPTAIRANNSFRVYRKSGALSLSTGANANISSLTAEFHECQTTLVSSLNLGTTVSLLFVGGSFVQTTGAQLNNASVATDTCSVTLGNSGAGLSNGTVIYRGGSITGGGTSSRISATMITGCTLNGTFTNSNPGFLGLMSDCIGSATGIVSGNGNLVISNCKLPNMDIMAGAINNQGYLKVSNSIFKDIIDGNAGGGTVPSQIICENTQFTSGFTTKSSYSVMKYSQCTFDGAMIFNAVNNIACSGCEFASTLVTNSTTSGHKITGCKFADNVTIGSPKTTISGCDVGSVNGGTKTITLQTTATKNIVTKNYTEAAIVFGASDITEQGFNLSF